MAKKTNLLQRTQEAIGPLQEQEASLDFLVPEIVQTWGELVGISRDDQTVHLALAYSEVATTVAHLLGLLGITEISEEALESVSKRWAANVNPWVAVGARVTALHEAFREAPEDVPTAAERLWAVLEYRAQAITGQPFSDVLR